MRLFIVFLSVLMMAGVLAQEPPPEATPETEGEEETAYLLGFPVIMPEDEQVSDAHACDVEALGEALEDELQEAMDTAKTACELMQVAVAQARSDSELSAGAMQTYARAVELNPALAYQLSVLITFFGQVDLVAPPDFEDNRITSIELTYSYMGIAGVNVNYMLTVTNAESRPEITGNMKVADTSESETVETQISGEIDPDLIQALIPAMDNLLPVAAPFSQVVCYDNYPDWQINITLAGTTVIPITTEGSNILNAGGPWFVQIDDQTYMQHSAGLLLAVLDIHEALELRYGETAAMFCGDVENPLDLAFDLPESDG